MEDDLRWRTTFDGRRSLMEYNLRWKTTFDGRRPSMEDDQWWRKTNDGRRPSMGDELQWRHPSMGEDLCDGRQLLMEDDLRWRTTFNGRRPSVEDDPHWKDFEIPLCHIPPLRSFFLMVWKWNLGFLSQKALLGNKEKPWPPKISGFYPLTHKKRKFVRTPPKKKDPHSWRGQHGMV